MIYHHPLLIFSVFLLLIVKPVPGLNLFSSAMGDIMGGLPGTICISILAMLVMLFLLTITVNS